MRTRTVTVALLLVAPLLMGKFQGGCGDSSGGVYYPPQPKPWVARSNSADASFVLSGSQPRARFEVVIHGNEDAFPADGGLLPHEGSLRYRAAITVGALDGGVVVLTFDENRQWVLSRSTTLSPLSTTWYYPGTPCELPGCRVVEQLDFVHQDGGAVEVHFETSASLTGPYLSLDAGPYDAGTPKIWIEFNRLP